MSWLRQWKPLKISVQDLQCSNRHISSLEWISEPSQNGLSVRRFKIGSTNGELVATGEIMPADQVARKNIVWKNHWQGSLQTTRFSKYVAELGVTELGFVANKVKSRFDLHWDGPLAIHLPSLSGHIQFRFDKGYIPNLSASDNAKVGLGRLMTLLNLNSLPRRLRFDFSDLFDAGYSFDLMQADLELRRGLARTDNFKLESAVAKMTATGDVGLVNHGVNMQLNITPNVTSSLPVVAAIAGGPVLGAATWIVNKAINPTLSHAVTHSYRISGTLDQPAWRPI
jgi:uncharacterized protein YhdP